MLKKRTFLDAAIIVSMLITVIFLKFDNIFIDKDVNPLATETSVMKALHLKDKEKNLFMPHFKFSREEFQAGMNILIYGHPDLSETRNVISHLRSLGINSVALNFPIYQSDLEANEVFTSNEHTPTNSELKEIINIAHDYELGVVLRPILDEQVFLTSSSWRGEIKPRDPNSWFNSYETLILNYAALAESTNAEGLNIGTELNSMQQHYQDRWIELIENVREIYRGELLYSFNYDIVSQIPSLEFVPLLDHIGIDAYFPLNLRDNASVHMLQKEWMNLIHHLDATFVNSSIIVTEVGVLPITGAYRTPYAWSIPGGTYDPQVQVDYYVATYEIWKPRSNGIYWWCVTLGDEPGNISYSPLNTPTEDVLKKFFISDVQDD